MEEEKEMKQIYNEISSLKRTESFQTRFSLVFVVDHKMLDLSDPSSFKRYSSFIVTRITDIENQKYEYDVRHDVPQIETGRFLSENSWMLSSYGSLIYRLQS